MKKLMIAVMMAMTVMPTFAAKAKKKAPQPIKPMKEFVDELMSKMTLQEKIGQLNLQVAGDITTGSAQDSEVSGLIAEGKMGGVFNLKVPTRYAPFRRWPSSSRGSASPSS